MTTFSIRDSTTVSSLKPSHKEWRKGWLPRCKAVKIRTTFRHVSWSQNKTLPCACQEKNGGPGGDRTLVRKTLRHHSFTRLADDCQHRRLFRDDTASYHPPPEGLTFLQTYSFVSPCERTGFRLIYRGAAAFPLSQLGNSPLRRTTSSSFRPSLENRCD